MYKNKYIKVKESKYNIHIYEPRDSFLVDQEGRD
jgi:hypothetical protein